MVFYQQEIKQRQNDEKLPNFNCVLSLYQILPLTPMTHNLDCNDLSTSNGHILSLKL